MKLPRTFAPLLLAGATCWWTACGHHEEHAADKEKGKAEEHATDRVHVEHTKEGETILDVPEEALKRMGLKVEPLVAAKLEPEVKAYGRVLDPAVLAALVSDMAAAQLTADVSAHEVERAKSVRTAEVKAADAARRASEAEFKRLKQLHEQNNVATRAVETAEAAVWRDQAQLESQKAASDRAVQTAEANAQRDQLLAMASRNKLVLATGRKFVERDDLPKLVQLLAAGESALVRVDLPAGESPAAPPTAARLMPATGKAAPVEAQLIGTAASVDPQLQAQGYLFLVNTGAGAFGANAAVTAWLHQPGEPRTGVIVPADAIVRYNGQAWIYVRVKDDDFTRHEVELETPQGAGWFIGEGLKPEDAVVTVGAQQLLSEELKGLGGSGE